MKYNGASIDDEMVVVNTFEQLGELLNKRMKPFYPDGDEEGWKKDQQGSVCCRKMRHKEERRLPLLY